MNFRSSLTFYAAKCPLLGGELPVVGPRPYANRQPVSRCLIRGDAPKAKSRIWRRRHEHSSSITRHSYASLVLRRQASELSSRTLLRCTQPHSPCRLNNMGDVLSGWPRSKMLRWQSCAPQHHIRFWIGPLRRTDKSRGVMSDAT